MQIDRKVVEQALGALSLALSDVDWRANSPTEPVIHRAYNALYKALERQEQKQEADLWHGAKQEDV